MKCARSDSEVEAFPEMPKFQATVIHGADDFLPISSISCCDYYQGHSNVNRSDLTVCSEWRVRRNGYMYPGITVQYFVPT
jgi:hypothetical protein